MQNDENAGRAVVSKRTADIVVALLLVVVGGIVMADSVRLGAGWSSDGPESGYFPFYVGLLIVISSIGTIVLALLNRSSGRGAFVERAQLRDVSKVLIPTAIFVVFIGIIGIYVAGAIFIAAFMRWIGRFRWHTIAVISLAVPFALFVLFEIWFLVPLPKGPIEAYLGY
jgi:hypothetical protein